MTKKELIEEARELGCKSIMIDGITYEIGPVPRSQQADSEIDEKALNIIISPLDNLSDEEVLYWSTPHYDTLKAQKELRAQQLKDESNDS